MMTARAVSVSIPTEMCAMENVIKNKKWQRN
jgi:hypothetical protein